MRILWSCLLLALSLSCATPEAQQAASTPQESSIKEHPLVRITRGNERFRSGQVRNIATTLEELKRLSQSQHPHTVLISCSDSRVEPGIVLDQRLGELFVIRTAGQALGKNVIASIEYAVENLGAEQILVMGHAQCGAVEATLKAMAGEQKASPALRALVEDISPRLREFRSRDHSENLVEESWANADGVARDLLRKSAIIRRRYETGRLHIASSLYFFETGTVEIKDPRKLRVNQQAQEE
jgi:carbonic anhydrase